MAKLEITLKRSVIGSTQPQRAAVQSLGLKKLNQSVVQEDNAAIRGLINKVSHLLEIKEAN